MTTSPTSPTSLTGTAADRPVTLPTGRLMVTAVAWAGGAGLAVTAALLATGRGLPEALAGLAGGAVVAVSAVTALLVLRPWKARPLHRWPAVWIAASLGRMVLNLGLAYLLYSAPTPLGTASLWLAVLVAYLAALVGETRAYASTMKRFGPAPTPVGPRATE